MGTIRILDPTGETRPPARHLAARVATLEGKVVGFLDNNKPNVGPLFDTLEQELRREFGVKDVIRRQKPQAPIPVGEEHIRDFLERCQAVVLAMAD
ncbi:MAG: hypothetical protein QOG69_2420 [Actinomycetota bacterium]|nr:hypothetical protein [Actinomycetota bacterium]